MKKLNAKSEESMSEIAKKEDLENINEDWAVLPFDEKEDDERWAKLIEETEELAENAAKTEAVSGKILMNETLSNIQIENKPTDDELF